MKQLRLALVASSILVCAAGAALAHNPPSNLHKVGDHWTAWNPPTSFPEGSQIHTIARGDTLWDLAETFYGDPYLWPQLWERNRYIEDAHWIYPGDPLVVGFEVTPLDNLADSQDAAGDGDGGDGFDRSLGAPEQLGFEADLYCSGYIAEAGREFPRQVVGSEYQHLGPTLLKQREKRRAGESLTAPTAKFELSLGDIVYLDGGEAAGMLPGTTYVAVRPERMVEHPNTGEVIGQFHRYLGQIRVLSVQETTAIAEISYSCHPMRIGTLLEPFEEQPIPLRRRTPMRGFNDPVSAEALEDAPVIVHSFDDIVSLGQSSVVWIDQGESDNVTPGDFYTIYRVGAKGMPPMVMGELAVLAVHGESSLARIIESRYAVYVGDQIDSK